MLTQCKCSVAAIMVAAFLLMSCCLRAQDARGTILGRVADSSGAVITGADVRATNTETGVSAVSKSNEAGNFVLAYLLPGVYRVEAEFKGFKKFMRQGIQVRVGDQVRVDIPLEIGNQTETVQVTAETPLLDTVDASLGQVVDQRQIQELPSFGGAPYNLALMAPGMINTTNLRQRYVGTPGAQGDFAVDGTGQKNSDFTIDGVPNSMDKGIVFVPPQMSVSEFKVQSLSYDASIGHTAGALVNVSLKSGTNDLHGEAHWFLRNKVFDTPTIFQNRAGQKVAPFQDHRYGLSGGGPVYLPKVYDGRNKTFWFYLWEANEVKYSYDYVNTVPTAAMKQGDLSGLLALGGTYQVYDPFSTQAVSGGKFQRTPIAGNIIPKSLLDPVALKIITHWPEPNQTGTKDFKNNHFVSYAGPFPVWTHLARVDHAFNPNHRVYFRLMREGFYSLSNRRFLDDNDGLDSRQDKWGFALDDVYVFNPSFFMDVRYGLAYRWGRNKSFTQGYDLSSLGFSSNLLSLLPDKELATFPKVVVSPFNTLQNSSSSGKWGATVNSLDANFTKLQGRHSIKFGAALRDTRETSNYFTNDVSPYLAYGSTYTNGPYNTSSAPTVGGEIASFLLGLPSTSAYLAKSASYADQETYLGLFVHDDINLTRRLTVNFGVRWEYETPVTERYNRSVAGFAFDQVSPIAAQAQANYAAGTQIPELPASAFKVMGGLTFAGLNGNPRGKWIGEKNNFMPRVGLAYQLRPTTILRAGYGIFYDSIGINGYNSIQTGFSTTTPVQVSMDSGLTYIASTANPFPNGLIQPLGAAGGLSTNLGQAVSFYARNRKNPYNQRWSFGVQHLLPGQLKFEATYVGNRGTRLQVGRSLNVLPQKYLSKSLVRDQATINYLSQVFPNPFYGTNSIYGKNISRQGLLLPYPQFGGVSVTEPIGYSWYHALQAGVERRFSKGFMFMMNYTFSRSMDATAFLNASDPMPYESLSTQDRPHRLVISGIWELPFGRKRHFGANMPSALNFFAGGWQLNGVVQRQSGPALEWGDVWTLFTGDSTKVGLSKSQRNVDRWFNTDAGFNKVSNQQLGSNVRYSPWRFSNLRADGQARWDFSIFKNFLIMERVTAQFRAEVVNAWNHPNLMTPVMTPTSSTFGMITSQDATRTWVMSLKLSF
jgi:hypothetical protein